MDSNRDLAIFWSPQLLATSGWSWCARVGRRAKMVARHGSLRYARSLTEAFLLVCLAAGYGPGSIVAALRPCTIRNAMADVQIALRVTWDGAMRRFLRGHRLPALQTGRDVSSEALQRVDQGVVRRGGSTR